MSYLLDSVQAEFTVHSAIIASQSKALDVLINGPMAEAFNGRAAVEGGPFVRFYQFACTGGYVTPKFTLIPAIELPYIPDRYAGINEPDPVMEEAAPPAPDEPPADEISCGSMPKKLKKLPKLSKSVRLRQLLDNMTFDTETSRATSRARCKVRPNSIPTEEYAQVFPGYVDMYVFAKKWDIALSKLHQTLISFTLYEVR